MAYHFNVHCYYGIRDGFQIFNGFVIFFLWKLFVYIISVCSGKDLISQRAPNINVRYNSFKFIDLMLQGRALPTAVQHDWKEWGNTSVRFCFLLNDSEKIFEGRGIQFWLVTASRWDWEKAGLTRFEYYYQLKVFKQSCVPSNKFWGYHCKHTEVTCRGVCYDF